MDEPGAFKCSFSQTVLRQTSLESIPFWGCARLSLGILPGLGVLSHILYAYLFVYLICLSKEPALGFVDLFIYLFFCVYFIDAALIFIISFFFPPPALLCCPFSNFSAWTPSSFVFNCSSFLIIYSKHCLHEALL